MKRLFTISAVLLLATACTSTPADDSAPPVAPVHSAVDSGPPDASHGTGDAGPMDASHANDASSSDADTSALDAGDAADDAPDDAATTEDAGMDASTEKVPVLAVGTITGATDAELTMIADGLSLANTTMKTSCFKDFILAASWTETNGLSQAQIYDKLCSGTITVDVDMYLGSWYENNVSRTIGYENEPGTVHMNRFFVDTAYMVADNLIHEGEGHSQGFTHYGVKATSVPYGLNDAFEACSPVGP